MGGAAGHAVHVSGARAPACWSKGRCWGAGTKPEARRGGHAHLVVLRTGVKACRSLNQFCVRGAGRARLVMLRTGVKAVIDLCEGQL